MVGLVALRRSYIPRVAVGSQLLCVVCSSRYLFLLLVVDKVWQRFEIWYGSQSYKVILAIIISKLFFLCLANFLSYNKFMKVLSDLLPIHYSRRELDQLESVAPYEQAKSLTFRPTFLRPRNKKWVWLKRAPYSLFPPPSCWKAGPRSEPEI
jgi:hypothetical protein